MVQVESVGVAIRIKHNGNTGLNGHLHPRKMQKITKRSLSSVSATIMKPLFVKAPLTNSWVLEEVAKFAFPYLADRWQGLGQSQYPYSHDHLNLIMLRP